jgi:hypothetical protein
MIPRIRFGCCFDAGVADTGGAVALTAGASGIEALGCAVSVVLTATAGADINGVVSCA